MGFSDLENSDEELYQDVVTQFPFLNGYSHFVFLFEPDSTVSRETVIATLYDGLKKLTDQIPWLAGQVLYTPGPPGSSGQYTLAPWPSDTPKNDMLRIKDCENLMPPMDKILKAGGPISMLDGTILAPFPGLPAPNGLKPPLPVMVFQVNFLRGGIIINMASHHMALDGTGIMQTMRHLSTVLHGNKISDSNVEQAMRDRRKVVPLIPREEPVKDHSFLRAPPGYAPAPLLSPPKWCVYKLPVLKLAVLEKLASLQLPEQQQQLSENDILSAFCWQRLTAARLARGFPPDTLTRMTRTIDARAAVGVPITYMGHLTYFSVSRLPMGQVAALPLSSIAQILRRELSGANTPWAIRSYATFLAREADRSRLAYTGLKNLNVDLGTTAFIASQSTRRDDGSALPRDFGSVLGQLKVTRRPNATPLPGGITICPVEGGALPLILCMPEADLEGLNNDPQWKRFFEHVG